MQASSRGFYDGRGQASYPSSSGRYQSYDPTESRTYIRQPGFPDIPEEEGYSGNSSYYRGYGSQDQGRVAMGNYSQEGNEEWESRGYGEAAQQQGFRDEPGGVPYSQDQQMFDVYSQSESDFLPPDGEAVTEDNQATKNSRVMDEVESFYNRPESVVEDVQKYYDDQGRLTQQGLEVINLSWHAAP